MSSTTFLTGSPNHAIGHVLEQIRAELARVEETLHSETTSSVTGVTDISKHVLQAGGKRLRPAVVALAARAAGGDYDATRVARIGAALELVHMATFVHDDVIDGTSARRGRPTANALYGNAASILTGDVMLARAMRLLAEDGDMSLIRVVTDMVVAMSEGAAEEAICRGRLELTEPEYFEIIRKKTAVFIEGCCHIGGVVGGGDADTVRRLAEYGYHVGMSFQVADDLLDYLGDPAKTGKAVGTDYKEGNSTLPLIHALTKAQGERAEILRKHFANGATHEDILAVAQVIRETGSDVYARDIALKHAEQALALAAGLPNTHYRDCLEVVARFVVSREV